MHTINLQQHDFSDNNLDKMSQYVGTAWNDFLRSAEGGVLARAILMLNRDIIEAQARIVFAQLNHSIEYDHIYETAYDHASGLLFKYDPAVKSEKSTEEDKSIRFSSFLTTSLKRLLLHDSVYHSSSERFWQRKVRSYVRDDKEGGWRNRVELTADPLNIDEYEPPISAQQLLDIIENSTLLDAREREIIKMRSGLEEGGKEHTLEEIGHKFGITRERVRQIENKAMMKLTAEVLKVAGESPQLQVNNGFSGKVNKDRNGSKKME